jgi:hypothetical protein
MPDRRQFVASLATSFAAPTLAQVAPLPVRMRAPLLEVAGAEQPVRLESLAIEVEAAGRAARSRVRLVFYNPNARVLEGRLSFPLADGQLVTGFALDVNGALREAVPVEKARAEQVFEAIVRRGVDPGLLQRSAGNAHELRLYPLPARGRRTVELIVDEPLDGGRLPIALGYEERVERLAVAVRVAAADAAPRLAARTPVELVFEQRAGGWGASASATWVKLPSEPLVVRWAEAREPVTVTTGRHGDRRYVALDLRIDGTRLPRALARRLQLVWDASGSGSERRLDRELALLDAYFRRAGDVDVNLVRVADAAAPAEAHRVRAGDWRALRRAIESTPFDGASHLADVRWDGSCTESIWLTDGLANWGTAPWPMTFPVPVYAIRSAPTANVAGLRRLADGSGGRLIDLTTIGQRDAVAALLERGWELADARGSGLREIAVSSRHPQRGMVRVAAVLTRPSAELALTLRAPDGTTRTRTLSVTEGDAPSRLAPWQWARLTLEHLESDARSHGAAIRALGQRFGLATSETSLLVLERVEDYVQHDIEPPAELRESWSRLVAQRHLAKARDDADRLELLVRRFQERVAWWNAEFPKDTPPPAQPVLQVAQDVAGALRRDARAPAPMAMARAEAAAAPVREADTARAPARLAAPMAKAAEAANTMMLSAPTSTLAAATAPADGDGERQGRIAIALEQADPESGAARRIAAAPGPDMWAVYLEERREHARSIAFFLDAAEAFLARGRQAEGLRVLSNLAELDLHNRQVLRLLGYRLQQADATALAVAVFDQVRTLAPHEPQSFRDLGLALAAAHRAQGAVDALYAVATGRWDARFPDIDLIALVEMNAIADAARREGRALDTSGVDPRLLRSMPLDLRVVLAWDADNTDVDLHVIDPNGEEVYFGHPRSWQGGAITRDATAGYGPEEFALRVAKPGRYRIEAQFYGHRQQVLLSSTGLMLWLSSGWGTERQEDRRSTVRVQSRSGARIPIGTFEVPA